MKKKGRDRKKTVMLEWGGLIGIVLLIALAVVGISSCPGKKRSDVPETEKIEPSNQPEEAKEEAVRSYTLSFAGDCTIGSLLEWQGNLPGDFQSVVGEDYAYPFSGVKEIFEADDLTSVNLEGTLTRSEEAVSKPYRFRADPAYVQVLTEGSVEAVSTANNHSMDLYSAGYEETLATLTEAGIWHAGAGDPLIQKLPGGMTLGMVAYNTVDSDFGQDSWRAGVKADIDLCKERGCDLIIGFMHWGTVEYLTEPEDWEVAFAREMADWGCDLIVGGHAHILQRMEIYEDVPIFYSMGNFCFGGNTNPDDKDSVIVQADYSYDPASGEVRRTSLRVIPCQISSSSDVNDYRPVPCEEGSEAYQRVLDKLNWQEAYAGNEAGKNAPV